MAVSGTWSSLCRGGWCLLLIVLLLPTAAVHSTDVVPQAPTSLDRFCDQKSVRVDCRSAATANHNCDPSRPSCSEGSCAIDHVETPEAAAQETSPWEAPTCPPNLTKCSGKVANQRCCEAIQSAMISGNNYDMSCVFKRLKEVGADKCKMMKCCYCNRWCTSCGGYLCAADVEGAYAY